MGWEYPIVIRCLFFQNFLYILCNLNQNLNKLPYFNNLILKISGEGEIPRTVNTILKEENRGRELILLNFKIY